MICRCHQANLARLDVTVDPLASSTPPQDAHSGEALEQVVPAVVGWGRGRSGDPFFGEEQRQSGYAFSKAGRLIEAKAEPVPGAIEPKATSIE